MRGVVDWGGFMCVRTYGKWIWVRYSNISKRLKMRGCEYSFECGHGRGYGRGEAAIKILGKFLKSNYF